MPIVGSYLRKITKLCPEIIQVILCSKCPHQQLRKTSTKLTVSLSFIRYDNNSAPTEFMTAAGPTKAVGTCAIK